MTSVPRRGRPSSLIMASQVILRACVCANLKRTICKRVVRLYNICTSKPYDLPKTIRCCLTSGPYVLSYVGTLRSFSARPPQIRTSITLNHLPPACPRLGYLDGFPTTSTFSRRRRPFGWNIHCSSVSARLVTTSTPHARLQPRRARCPNPDSSDSTVLCRSLHSRQHLDSQRRP